METQAEGLLAEMSLREKVLQMFIVTPEQLAGVSGPVTQCGDTSRQAIQDNPVGASSTSPTTCRTGPSAKR